MAYLYDLWCKDVNKALEYLRKNKLYERNYDYGGSLSVACHESLDAVKFMVEVVECNVNEAYNGVYPLEGCFGSSGFDSIKQDRLPIYEYLISVGADPKLIRIDCLKNSLSFRSSVGLSIFMKYYQDTIKNNYLHIFNGHIEYYILSTISLSIKKQLLEFYLLCGGRRDIVYEHTIDWYRKSLFLNKRNLIHSVIRDSDNDTLKLLIENNFDLNVKDNTGRTPINLTNALKNKLDALQKFDTLRKQPTVILNICDNVGYLSPDIQKEIKRRNELMKDMQNMRGNVDNYLSRLPIDVARLTYNFVVYT